MTEATKPQTTAWERCQIGSCQRHRECMYMPCRAPQATEQRRLDDKIKEAEADLMDAEFKVTCAEDALQDAEDRVTKCGGVLEKLHQQRDRPTDADILAACHADPRQIGMPFPFKKRGASERA